jgi:hypothetical protein
MSERPARPKGRPPLDSRYQSVAVSVRLTAPDYDSICQQAKRQQVSVADMLRQRLHRDDDDD